MELITYWITKHQHLLDVMKEYENEDGICNVTQKELAQRLGISQSFVAKQKKAINLEEEIITYTSKGYVVTQYDLMQTKTFRKMYILIALIIDNPRLLYIPEKELAEKAESKLTTVKMIKTMIKMDYQNYTKMHQS